MTSAKKGKENVTGVSLNMTETSPRWVKISLGANRIQDKKVVTFMST